MPRNRVLYQKTSNQVNLVLYSIPSKSTFYSRATHCASDIQHKTRLSSRNSLRLGHTFLADLIFSAKGTLLCPYKMRILSKNSV